MQLKIHRSYRDVIAVCDTELIGKFFEQENTQLDLKPSFYQGDELNSEEMLKTLKKFAKEDATFNIAGKNSIALALQVGIIEKSGIKKIAGIPFALVLM